MTVLAIDAGTTGVTALVVDGSGSLVAKGYLPGGEATPPVNSLAFRRALARFQADNRMVVTGTVNFPTYERVLRDFVALDANGQLTDAATAENLAKLLVALAERVQARRA